MSTHYPHTFLIFFKAYFYYVLIGKADIQRGETERKIFHLMIHSPNECNSPCYAGLKPGASSGSPTRVQGPKALGRACRKAEEEDAKKEKDLRRPPAAADEEQGEESDEYQKK